MSKFLDALAKLTSRKFLLVLAADAATLVTVFSTQQQGEAVANAIVAVGGMIAIVLASLGYATIEGRVDQKALDAETQIRVTAIECAPVDPIDPGLRAS